jgi:DNA-binding LacI/PurR family transcriptional regulator
MIGRPKNPSLLPWVDNDNFHAAYDVVNRMIEHGARAIAFLGGPSELQVTRDRLEGYRRALANRGLHSPVGGIRYAAEVTESAGYRTMLSVLSEGTPDALLATDDLLAAGAVKAITDRGIDPIQCVGFNNTPVAAEYARAISSVDIQAAELGRHAARLLIDLIEGREPGETHVIIPTRFVSPREG